MQPAQCVLLLAGNFALFRFLRSYSSRTRSYALLTCVMHIDKDRPTASVKVSKQRIVMSSPYVTCHETLFPQTVVTS